jgi:hypothetical protein
MVKYADDTYIIVPACNAQSCVAEIENIEKWSQKNNLALNRKKSSEVIFLKPRGKRQAVVPPPSVPGFTRQDTITALGVTFNHKLSFKSHVDNLLAACARTLFALRVLNLHGMPNSAIHVIFQATIVAKLTYASPAWYGFCSAADRDRIEVFLRRAEKFDYRNSGLPSFHELCCTADDKLFDKIMANKNHLLHPILPNRMDFNYLLRQRAHSYVLPSRTSCLMDCNFITRVLYKDKSYRPM